MIEKLMENMTWSEIKQGIKKTPLILIPLGPKLKEHGLHLPMNTDYILAEYFRDQLLMKFDVMSASTIDINYFPAFTEYPGSEHLTLDTAIELVYQKCKCHVNHGITHIYIINMGISTNQVLEKVKQLLIKDNVVLDYTNLKIFNAEPEIKNILKQKQGTHADELETSMMLYIKPEVVNLSRTVKDDNDEIDPKQPGPLTPNPLAKIGVFSPTGAWGNPTLATVEKGRKVVTKYLELMTQQLSNLIMDCKNRASASSLMTDNKISLKPVAKL
jgi:creatinine amidohydrolase